MIRVGIIGCGRVATVRHIPECFENSEIEIRGYYNRTKEKAMQMAERYGGKVYDDIGECILDSDVDVVIISTPNKTHAPISIRALDEGKHVICEKPMAVTEEECKRMVDTAREKGRILLIGYQERYTQTHRMARKLIADGMIGKVLNFQVIFAHGGPEKKRPSENLSFYDKEQAGMGASMDLGVHKIDTMRFLLNDEVGEIAAKRGYIKTVERRGIESCVDNNAAYILRMQKGAVGTVTASWTCYGEEKNFVIIFGSEGTMLIEHPFSGKVRIMMKDGAEKEISIKEHYRADGWIESGIIREMIRLIKRGEKQTGEDALKTMQAVFTAVECEDRMKIS